MIIYHGTDLIGDELSCDDFMAAFANAVASQSSRPFLLVRPDDGCRMLIATDNGLLLLAVAHNSSRFGVSHGSTYAEGDIRFQGIQAECTARSENFIDARLAMNGIRAFFASKRLRDHFNIMPSSLPDRDILYFPKPIAEHVYIKPISKSIVVTELLQNDMKNVCEFVAGAENDSDENIDFGDAIQIGSLIGGRMDHKANRYVFSHYTLNGEVWSFEINRTIMERLAEGSTTQLTVSASKSSNVW